MGDNSGHTVNAASGLACRRILRALIEKYDWALLHEDELVELVLGSIQSEAVPAEVERLARHYYTIAWYEACRQAEDLERRERGYDELSRYLYRAAYNRWPELAEDAAQRALLLVFEQIDRCREPGAFLAFALYKLRHAFKEEQRRRGDIGEEDWSTLLSRLGEQEYLLVLTISETGDSHGIDPESRLAQQERGRALQDAIARLPDERQRVVILLKFRARLSDEEIGEHLGITAGHVRVLRHRAMARLRQDDRLKDFEA